MTHATYADVFRPTNPGRFWLYNLGLILGFSILIGLSAQISIPLPFTPVPITGQTLTVLLTGAVLGSRRGALAVLTYLAQGFAGLPVFAGGKFGLATLFGPTGGYLLGFVVAAFVTGWLAERGWDRNFKTNALAMLAGNVVIYLVGLPWLAVFTGANQAIALGLLPFIPGDLLKLALATALLPIGWRLVRSPQPPTQ